MTAAKLCVLAGLWLSLAAHAMTLERALNVRVPMRDGVQLSTNVFRPPGAGRVPAILIRTPYDKGAQISANNESFVEHGYAIVVQDVRGRYASQGVFRAFEQEGPDGEDTIAWIARQPWCDGKVGMMGGSYLGMTQWHAALRNPPALKAIFPANAGYDDYVDRYYSRGGAFKLGHRLEWIAENFHDAPPPEFTDLVRHLPLRTADRFATGHSIEWFQRLLDHPSYDAFWHGLSIREKIDHMHVPVFAIAGWFDNYAQSDLEAFEALRKLKRESKILVGPWPHSMNDRITTIDLGPEWYVPLRRQQFEWFDHWLKGKELPRTAPMRYFVTGVNRWQDTTDWPPPEARIRSYFLGDKGALAIRRQRSDKQDVYVYDPRNPVPTRGGPLCCNFSKFPAGPVDQRPVESRGDVVIYTAEVLKKDLEVTGDVRASLYVSTSALDTDFTAKLVDVYPDGRAMSVTDGILRLRYRSGLDKPELAKPAQVYQVTIDLGPASLVFRAGHRIRLEVSSSNFPRFDRNPNTGRAVADETELRTAHQAIHHGALTPSALLLPVMPPKAGKP